MIDLVRKKHHGDGWLVFAEVGDKPGLFRNRIADGLALGVWASKHYEAHLYEFKESREDLKKELADPSKAEGVGKWCHFWWLAIRDEKLIEGLEIPKVWGIVTPTVRGGSEMFKVLRKAPNLKPEPFGPMFAVSLLRNMAKKWTPTHELEEFKEQLRNDIREELERERKYSKESTLADYRRLARDVQEFERVSGVRISQTPEYADEERVDEDGKPLPWSMGDWQIGRIAKAVRVVLEARDARGLRGSFDANDELEDLIQHEIAQVERGLENYRRMITTRESAKFQLEAMLQRDQTERAVTDIGGKKAG